MEIPSPADVTDVISKKAQCEIRHVAALVSEGESHAFVCRGFEGDVIKRLNDAGWDVVVRDSGSWSSYVRLTWTPATQKTTESRPSPESPPSPPKSPPSPPASLEEPPKTSRGGALWARILAWISK